MPWTYAPVTGARKLSSVSVASVMQSGAEFFWRQILESNRTVFYFATESGNHVIKILSCELVIGQCSMLLPAALRAAQACRYLIYSEADFEFFCPAGVTRCTDGGEI